VTPPDDTAVRLAGMGHRVTATRRAVLDAMGASAAPFTIEDLCAAVPGVGRATVFRTVKLLQDHDVLCRVVLEDGGVRYQMSTGGHHHHLVCSQCGGVQEFADPTLDMLIQENARGSSFQLDGHSLELYGRCGQCAAGP
jgi:Fur family transcriptional regulator, ferric uptake regulator